MVRKTYLTCLINNTSQPSHLDEQLKVSFFNVVHWWPSEFTLSLFPEFVGNAQPMS